MNNMETKSKVAKCKNCGMIILAADFKESESDKEVQKMFHNAFKEGHTIDIVDDEEVRTSFGHNKNCPLNTKRTDINVMSYNVPNLFN